jgi:hypothetical protein
LSSFEGDDLLAIPFSPFKGFFRQFFGSELELLLKGDGQFGLCFFLPQVRQNRLKKPPRMPRSQRPCPERPLVGLRPLAGNGAAEGRVKVIDYGLIGITDTHHEVVRGVLTVSGRRMIANVDTALAVYEAGEVGLLSLAQDELSTLVVRRFCYAQLRCFLGNTRRRAARKESA